MRLCLVGPLVKRQLNVSKGLRFVSNIRKSRGQTIDKSRDHRGEVVFPLVSRKLPTVAAAAGKQ